MSMFAVLIPALAVFVLLATAASFVVGAISKLIPSRVTARFSRSTLLWAAIVILPLAIAFIGAITLILPTPFAACHCGEHGLHHPHLCLWHPALGAPLVTPALVVLAAWLCPVAPRLLGTIRDLVRSTHQIRRVRELSPELLEGTPVRFADCGSPTAFTAGAFSPIVVVDRALWNELGETERRAVLHHEIGHIERRDGFTYLVLRFCLALQPWLPARLLDSWRFAAELECDRRAASELSDPTAVAGALVAIERLRAGLPDLLRPAGAALGVFERPGLERRVMALLDPRRDQVRAKTSANDVLGILVVMLGALVLALAWPGDFLHHAIETAIGLLGH